MSKIVKSDAEIFSIDDIDKDFLYLEINRPNEDQVYYDSDYAELMEESNKELRDQVGVLILTVKDALERV